MLNSSATEIEIKTRNFRFSAKRWGVPGKRKVLGLHGWLDNAATFDRLAPLLKGIDLISLDFAGHGFSDHRSDGIRYHYVDYISDVISVADQLGWDTFSMLGHSLGAGVACMTAGVIPDRITQLILIEGMGPMTRDPINSALYFAKSVHQMKMLEKKQLPIYPNLDAMIQARAVAGDMAMESVKILVQRGSKEYSGGVTWRSDPRLKISSPLYLTEEQVFSILDKIQASALLIIGDSGYLANRDYLSMNTSHFRKLQVETLIGGHHLHLDDPESVARVVDDFIIQNDVSA